jgi:pimeloyl-ACP methyl ester carboxylesterase
MQPVSRFVTVGAIRTHLTETGNGPAVVLLHGIGGPLMWQRLLAPLSEQFHVIQVDLPGFGDSDPPPRPFSTDDYAGFVGELLPALSPGKVVLVGISYGGQIALHAAAKAGNLVGHLVLINTTGLYRRGFLPAKHPRLWRVFSFFARTMLLKNLWFLYSMSSDSFADIRSRPDNLCEDFHRQLQQPGKREAWLQCLRNIFTPDEAFAARAGELEVPTCIIAGALDVTVAPRYAELLHGMIGSSELIIMPGCAHSLPLEKPGELSDAIHRFIRPSQE